MKKLLLAAITCLSVVFTGCDKHADVLNTDFQVGNILCADGSVLHPSIFDANINTPVGVVFWANNGDDKIKDMGYAVALEDLEACILIDENENMTKVSESETAFDGAANTAAIIVYGASKEKETPAATKAIEYLPAGFGGWFIPSAAQAKEIYNARSKINSTLALLNAEKFEGWFWTSTEDGRGQDTPNMYALIASLSEGRISVSDKKKINKVRPIIAIK